MGGEARLVDISTLEFVFGKKYARQLESSSLEDRILHIVPKGRAGACEHRLLRIVRTSKDL